MTAPVPCVCRPAPVEGQQHSPACRFQRRDAEQHKCMGAQALNADWHCRCFVNIERPCCRCGHDGDEDGVCPAASEEADEADVEPRERVMMALRAHPVECTGPGEVSCGGCRDRGWMTWPDFRAHVADAVFDALGLEQVGWGGDHGDWLPFYIEPYDKSQWQPVYRLRVNGDAS